MVKTEVIIPLGRKCRMCKEEIVAVICKDEDGYFVCERCGCENKGFLPRVKNCDLPEYKKELKARIAANLRLLNELNKYQYRD
ncbi:MAG: hypothetical protein J6P03_06890 [Opitutales bacterium]|nr:hypothetical protein [Opitutales bacterium]